MNQVIYFRNGKAESLITHHPAAFVGDPNCLINPEISSEVHMIPMKHWKLEGGEIIPMTLYEKSLVDFNEAHSIDEALKAIDKQTVTSEQIHHVESELTYLDKTVKSNWAQINNDLTLIVSMFTDKIEQDRKNLKLLWCAITILSIYLTYKGIK